ncbi:nucleotide-binding protein [Mycetocola reblochoni]|uniref:MinD/ParA family ATP-binding protein n=1 Tax=Mycetocola reblochoni TaxID=331618 RepID=UPI003F9A8046
MPHHPNPVPFEPDDERRDGQTLNAFGLDTVAIDVEGIVTTQITVPGAPPVEDEFEDFVEDEGLEIVGGASLRASDLAEAGESAPSADEGQVSEPHAGGGDGQGEGSDSSVTATVPGEPRGTDADDDDAVGAHVDADPDTHERDVEVDGDVTGHRDLDVDDEDDDTAVSASEAESDTESPSELETSADPDRGSRADVDSEAETVADGDVRPGADSDGEPESGNNAVVASVEADVVTEADVATDPGVSSGQEETVAQPVEREPSGGEPVEAEPASDAELNDGAAPAGRDEAIVADTSSPEAADMTPAVSGGAAPATADDLRAFLASARALLAEPSSSTGDAVTAQHGDVDASRPDEHRGTGTDRGVDAGTDAGAGADAGADAGAHGDAGEEHDAGGPAAEAESAGAADAERPGSTASGPLTVVPSAPASLPAAAATARRARTLDQDRAAGRDVLAAAPAVAPEPRSGWRRLVQRASFGLVTPGESTRDRDARELEEFIGAPLTGGTRFVPVLSRKGGVGKTTVTSLLGMALATGRADRVVAVDANPDRGTLSERVVDSPRYTARDVVNRADRITGFTELSELVARDRTRLDVIASDTDPHVSEAFDDADYETIAALCERYYSLVLTDCGTGIVHAAMRATLDRADTIVIVSGGSVDEARLATETLDWLETNGYASLARRAVVVLNATSAGAPVVRLDELERHFAPRVGTVVRIPYDAKLAAGTAIRYDELHARTRAAARRLSAAIVGSLAGDASRHGAEGTPERTPVATLDTGRRNS